MSPLLLYPHWTVILFFCLIYRFLPCGDWQTDVPQPDHGELRGAGVVLVRRWPPSSGASSPVWQSVLCTGFVPRRSGSELLGGRRPLQHRLGCGRGLHEPAEEGPGQGDPNWAGTGTHGAWSSGTAVCLRGTTTGTWRVRASGKRRSERWACGVNYDKGQLIFYDADTMVVLQRFTAAMTPVFDRAHHQFTEPLYPAVRFLKPPQNQMWPNHLDICPLSNPWCSEDTSGKGPKWTVMWT